MYKYQSPSRHGIDGRKASKCVSILTGETVTRASLNALRKPAKKRKGKK